MSDIRNWENKCNTITIQRQRALEDLISNENRILREKAQKDYHSATEQISKKIKKMQEVLDNTRSHVSRLRFWQFSKKKSDRELIAKTELQLENAEKELLHERELLETTIAAIPKEVEKSSLNLLLTAMLLSRFRKNLKKQIDNAGAVKCGLIH